MSKSSACLKALLAFGATPTAAVVSGRSALRTTVIELAPLLTYYVASKRRGSELTGAQVCDVERALAIAVWVWGACRRRRVGVCPEPPTALLLTRCVWFKSNIRAGRSNLTNRRIHEIARWRSSFRVAPSCGTRFLVQSDRATERRDTCGLSVMLLQYRNDCSHRTLNDFRVLTRAFF